MAPLTQTVPKVLLPAAGRPFLDHQLTLLASQGIHDVVLSIGRLGHLVREFAGDGARWGVRVRYSEDGPAPLGTGGAIRLAAERGLLDSAFLLIYGDSYTPISFAAVEEAFHAQNRPALMVVMNNADRWDRSNVLIDQERLVVYDKTRKHPRSAEMRHIDYGVAVLGRDSILRELPPGNSDLASFYHALSLRCELGWREESERFYEIGSPAGLAEFEQYLAASLEYTGGHY